jgi:2-polyprenyl-6-hydroxyphenyl methylase/3-demethylubiquinone-9 3-methyltransferase
MPTLDGRARYAEYWGKDFWRHVGYALAGAETVLDVGGGRRPTLLPHERPSGRHYVGFDISAAELEAAPPGSYDEIVAARAEDFVPQLAGRFDLIVAWQVLEHVADLPRAAANFHSYARVGGTLVAMLSGRNAAFAIANRMLPAGFGERLVARLRRRPPETVFPAHYDHCDERGLRVAFAQWELLDIAPHWHGADYFERLPGLRGLYLRYEDAASARGWSGLATHYVVCARKLA